MDEPSPAPRSTSTVCPARTSAVTPAGVSATRYSRFLTSRGTPTRIVDSFVSVPIVLPRVTGGTHRCGGGPVGACLRRSLGTQHRAPPAHAGRSPSPRRPARRARLTDDGRKAPPARRTSMRLYAQRPDLRLRQIL